MSTETTTAIEAKLARALEIIAVMDGALRPFSELAQFANGMSSGGKEYLVAREARKLAEEFSP